MSVGAIGSAIYRARWGPFPGRVDIYARAAVLLRGLVLDHPFADGNKRTAIEVVDTFLLRNGHMLLVQADEGVAFLVEVAQGHLDLRAIRAWLRDRTEKA